MTELSYFLVERVLHNSVNVMKRQRDELGIKEYPLFSHDELDDIAPLFQGFKYNREVDWAAFQKTRAGFLSPTLEFYDAGHALGSAGIMVRGQKETVFYTGDVCFHDQTILRKARFEGVNADVLIMETTRGNRELPPGFSRESEIERLSAAIQRVLERKGSILIPTFALGRTQEILAAGRAWGRCCRSFSARRMHFASRFCAWQNAGDPRHVLQIPPREVIARFPDLHRRPRPCLH